MNKIPTTVVKNVTRRIAFMSQCSERTAKDITRFVLNGLTTEDIKKLAKWRGLKLLKTGE